MKMIKGMPHDDIYGTVEYERIGWKSIGIKNMTVA